MDEGLYGSKPPADWKERMGGLAAFLPVFSAPDFSFGEWQAPEPQEEGVTSLGYFSFSAEASGFIQAMYKLGLIRTDLDWPSWHCTPDGHALISDRQRVASASAEELANVLTTLVRGDRFADGTLEDAWGSGVLLAVVRRAAELVDGTGDDRTKLSE
jgi:hypothetical protein